MPAFRLLFALASAAGLSGCSLIPPEWQKRLLDTGLPFLPAPTGGAAVSVSEEVSPETAKIRAHVELLAEVYRVTFLKDAPDAAWLSGYADNLRQGGSIEGVYNGWVRSADYRIRENEKGAAPAGALRAFARELAVIESAAHDARLFTDVDAQPARLLSPEEEDAVQEARTTPTPTATAESAFGRPLDTAPLARAGVTDASSLSGRYEAVFFRARLFTLKRILGDEALRLVAEKAVDPKALSTWYSAWAAQMAQRGVDFGHEKRNLAVTDFHRDWAMGASPDRIGWEVLNRLHRILNAAASP